MEISPLMFMIKQNGDNKSSCNILLSFLFLTSSHSNLNTHKNEKQLINSLDEALQCGYQNSAFLMFYLIPLWALDIIFPHKTDKFGNFNYLNVAFISYKLTMWDLMLISGCHTRGQRLRKKDRSC